MVGMRSECGVIETAWLQSIIGVVFHPGGTLPFLGWSAGEFYNREVPLDLIWGTAASRRRFAQLFREQVGLTPKLYCRLRRFQEVVRKFAAGGPVDFADVAAAGGYCDQAHLANDFRAFSGVSPGAWLSAERPFQNHAAMD
jgi:AraC-like DNA-binding protein